ALAGALAPGPDLVLLDEPTANLDPAGADLVRAALAAALRDRDATLVMVEHRGAGAVPRGGRAPGHGGAWGGRGSPAGRPRGRAPPGQRGRRGRPAGPGVRRPRDRAG